MLGGHPAPTPATARPTPVARLAATTLWLGGDELVTATIRLRFEYAAGAARDRAAESLARRVLESLGAVDLSCLEDLATETPADYAVRLDNDVHALCSFTA